jgi:hypothetical protein
MSAREFLDVDPRTLRLPPSRRDGADPVKLQRQIVRHGKSLQGMPPVLVYRGFDAELMITDGVTGNPSREGCARNAHSRRSARPVAAKIRFAADRGGKVAMNNSVRAEVLARLGELSQACPEMRLGQLIANMAVVARGTDPGAVWEMEDEELLAAVNWQMAELMRRRGSEVA